MAASFAAGDRCVVLEGRQPPRGLVHHSDRGSQYASEEYQQALAARGIECGMSRKGNCWDNAVVESFFSTLKQELVYATDFTTRQQARLALFGENVDGTVSLRPASLRRMFPFTRVKWLTAFTRSNW